MTTPTEDVIGLRDVVGHPHEVAERLRQPGAVFGLTDVEVRVADGTLVVFWITLEPWAPMAERGYPTEQVSIAVWADGRIAAVPVAGSGRSWQHRNPFVLGWLEAIGELCLWYPGDPRPLRWEWQDGLIAYITIVHRHLQAEEYARRNHGRWPAEDAPHGSGRHPIRTPALRALAAGTAA